MEVASLFRRALWPRFLVILFVLKLSKQDGIEDSLKKIEALINDKYTALENKLSDLDDKLDLVASLKSLSAETYTEIDDQVKVLDNTLNKTMMLIHKKVDKCPAGFFRIKGSACLRMFNDVTVTWSEAVQKCQAEGLSMPTHTDDFAVELRKYLLDNYDDNTHAWLGASGSGSDMVWLDGDANPVVGRNNKLWENAGEGNEVDTTQCLGLWVWKWALDHLPTKPYVSWPCTGEGLPGMPYTLCQSPDYVDKCQDNPCFNGGTCRNATDNYTCVCPRGFAGENCEEVLGICAFSNPCVNGISHDTAKSYQCYCKPRFTGEDCEEIDCTCK